jgi:hypothetical protein
MQADSTHLVTVKIKHLRPTQITVGMIAVKAKAAKWEMLSSRKRKEHLQDTWFPAIKGPDDAYYITDHHHTGLALLRSGVKKGQVIVLKDLSSLKPGAFWMAMDHHNWVHPYNAKGKRDDFSAIPERLEQLDDDPYRSLADQVQKLGGYAETSLPYAEFLWADYFREHVRLQTSIEGWDNTLATALALAKDTHAQCLPGWCGPTESK